MHVISDAGPHPFFRTLLEGGALPRTAVWVGSVGPAGPLQDDMRELGVGTFALGTRNRAGFPSAVVRLSRLLRRIDAQVVQTHLVDGSLVGLAAARTAAVPVAVFTAHHSHELPFHGPKLIWADRFCARMCDHIIAPSAQVAEVITDYTRVDGAKIEIVHHGFDLDRLDPAGRDGGAALADLGIDRGPILGAIGRLYSLKNYSSLISAFRQAAPADAKLVIVGPGDASPLLELASELGIADRVFLTGPRADVAEMLAAFDVFVHPALAESFGMVIVEAMAMAKPVVSTPVGIAPEVIEAGVTGVLAKDGSVGALAEALESIFLMRDRWITLGTNGRERVSGFTADAMASRYAQLYRGWLAQGRSSRD